MGKIFSLSQSLSPKIAELFGLKPAFVTFLFVILGGMFYGVINIKDSFEEQNKLLIEQIATTNKTLERLDGKITQHELRIVSLETRVSRNTEEMMQEREKTNANLARLDTKLDMITFDVRSLTANAMALHKVK